MPQHNCQHGSCGIPIRPGEGVRIVGGGYNVRFCSWNHAVSWALAIAANVEGGQNRGEYFRVLSQLPKKAS